MGERGEKKLLKLARHPKDVRPEELRSVLEAFGYRLDRQSGSHQTFVRQDSRPITVPYRRPSIKEVYVRRVIALLRDDIEGGDSL